MRRFFDISMRLLCALAGLTFLAFLAGPPIIISSNTPVPDMLWLDVYLKLLYLGASVWAFLMYRKVDGRAQRLHFLSIVALVLLVFAADTLAWLRPQLAPIVHHPIGTILGYLFGMLVIVGILVDPRSRRRAEMGVDR